MTLDDGVTKSDLRAAVAALKAMRTRPTQPLDRMLDALGSRRVAHVAEEALRLHAGGVGLWRRTGGDESLIRSAIAWLNSSGPVTSSPARTRRSVRDGAQVVRGEGGAS